MKNLFTYSKGFEKLLNEDLPKTNWKQEHVLFLQNLSHLKHERHMHLLVTLTIGLACLLSSLTTLFFPSVALFIFDFALFCLLIAYLVHYRKLENTTQGWYQIADKLAKKTVSG